MFRQVLSTTPFCNDIADDYFANIKCTPFQSDNSFVSTIRALVAPRMTDGDNISIKLRTVGYSGEHDIDRLLKVDNVYIDEMGCGEGVLCNLNGRNQNNAAMIEKLKKDFVQTYSNWKIIDKVESFFRKTFSTVCFVNPGNKNFIVFVDNMDIRKYHYLQCGIPAFMPWYFDPEQGISEEEMELIKSLREHSSQKYEACLAKMAEQYNFREMRIKKLLNGFESRFDKAEIKNIEYSLSDVIRKINDYNERIGECLKQKRDYEVRMLGLKNKIAEGSGESAMMDYFLCNKNIHLISINDESMKFCTTGYVSYYDEDEAEILIAKPTSCIYKPGGSSREDIIPAKDMELLMRAIFLDRALKMKFCAAYKLDLTGNVEACSSYNYGTDFSDCTPNTHIDRYACMGNYQRIINDLLIDHDYIGAIEQCMASTISLNFSDSCVMEEFMRRMYGISDYNVNIRCIELPDGKVVEPKEAIEYLKSQNAQEGEENG